MGQKVNPKVFRLGPVYTWSSRWFANDAARYRKLVLEDAKIRKALMDKLRPAGVARVEIERSINAMTITLHVARPGVVIGRGGQGLEDLKKHITTVVAGIYARNGVIKKDAMPKVELRVELVKEPSLDAYLVASQIADQLVRRLPYKRVMKQSIERVMGSGAKGARILLSGRINGAEIARREKVQEGTVPLSTIREHIDFAAVPALTKSGYIGVKVWINRPEEK